MTATSAFVEAICVAIGVKSVTSAGNTFEETVLTPAPSQDALCHRDLRLSERVVDRRVRRRLRPLARGHRRDPLRERHEVVLHRDGDVEYVVQPRAEHRRAAAGTLDERIAVARRHARRRQRQQRRERPEHERILVRADQLLVVRHDLRRARGVIEDVHRDLVPEQPAVGVLVLGPELIALLERLPVGREVARERQRCADRDRGSIAAATAAGAICARAAAATATAPTGCEHGRCGQSESSPRAVAQDPHLSLPPVRRGDNGCRATANCNRLQDHSAERCTCQPQTCAETVF